MSTRTRTVVFTDLADYTAQVERSDRESLRALLAHHERLVGPVVRRHGGQVLKNLGDSFLCLFDAATDAVRAALDLQAEIARQSTPELRVAIATGDVEELDGDVFGDVVNRAARILGKTPAGEVWFGPATRACMNASEIPWEPVGRLAMKGIAGDVDVSRAVPAHRCWLPDLVVAAARSGRIVRVRRGGRLPARLPPEPVVLLEDFAAGSPELAATVARLPVLDPDRVFLVASTLAPVDRHAWTEAGRGVVVGTPQAVERALGEAAVASSRRSGASTILIDEPARLELVLAGLALPAMPLADVVASYAYELLADGTWVDRSEQAAVRIEVSPEGATIVVTGRGVAIDGRQRAVDERVRARDGLRLEVGGRTHLWRTLDQAYVGALVAETTTRLGVDEGQTIELGREPSAPGFVLPDRRGQANLRWCSGARAAKAREGGFTLDRALAGRKQASVRVDGDVIRIVPLHEHCPTWILRRGRLARVSGEVQAQLDDLVLVGTTVIALRRP